MSCTVIEPLRASRSSWARHSRLNAATSSSRASSANISRKFGLAPLPEDREDRSQSSVIWYRFEMAITSSTRRAAQCLPAQFTTYASWRSPIRSPVSKGKLPIIWQLPPWPNAETTSPTASTASSAVAPRSTLSRHRSRQHVPSPSCFWLLNAASLPTATPCSLHASSAPPSPERAAEDDLVGARCLRDRPVGDAGERSFAILPPRIPHHLLGLVHLGVGALGQQHRTALGAVSQGCE